jgi:serine/threonine-protein kinase
MTAAADRHLLLGLLALQTGIINQGQLVAAFQAWTLDKSISLADHLEARGDLTGPKRAALEAIAAVHIEAHDDDVEKSLAVPPANRSTRASLEQLGEPEIGATLARVTRTKHREATADDGGDDPDLTASLSVGVSTSDGQRFRVLRPHARGGLGEVFVALDAELHREVALKQILEKHADDPASRQRFVAEAEITGGLEHPGVVPVYGLGTYGDGRPFYAMRFIKGETLKEVIERYHADESLKRDAGRRSLELRKLLRRFMDVCNAIEYAHSRGVLHRDIKPANIIVAKHGETLIVDWGLAKATGRSEPASEERTLLPTSTSGSAQTLQGSALGTPAFMSPEQARGEVAELGARSDVYSLGATLYCLLTGTPPFQGDDVGELLRKVQRGEFPPPCALDPAIDGALEAVCKKAMATKPVDRYGSARALADDIERWMADEPVVAWTEPWTRTVLRWLARHRVGVTAAAAAGLVALVGCASVAATQAQGRAALEIKNRELAAANAKVQARYDLAVDAVKTFYTGVSEDFLLKEERFKSVRDRLLKAANEFYAKLAALLSRESDPASRRALGQANFAAAELTDKVGQKEAALAAHQQVLRYREDLAAEPGALPALKIDVSQSLTTVARLLCLTGQTDPGLAAYRRAEAILAEAAPSDPALVQDALAACRVAHGYSLSNAGRKDDALAVLRTARAELEARAAVQGLSTAAQDELARAVRLIAVKLGQIGHYAEAEVELRTALAMQQKLADDSRANASCLSDLAQSHGSLAGVLEILGRPHEALAEYRVALLIQQKLTANQPAVTRFRLIQAWYHRGAGRLLGNSGHGSEGLGELRRALAIEQKLADEQPAYTQCRESLASTHHFIGVRFAREGQPAPALKSYRAEVAILEELMKQQPDNPGHRDWFANAANDAAGALIELGRTREARALCERALATNEARVRADAQTLYHSISLAESLMRMGQVRRAEGDLKGAALDWHRAAAMYAARAAASEARVFEACCHAGLAGIAGVAGSGVSVVQGAAATETAIAKLREAVALGMRDLAWLRTDSLLDPLRARPDFQSLLMDLAMPADPFASPRAVEAGMVVTGIGDAIGS